MLTLFTMLAFVAAMAMPSFVIALPQDDSSGSDESDKPAAKTDSGEGEGDEPVEAVVPKKKRKRGMRSTQTTPPPPPASPAPKVKKGIGMRTTGSMMAQSQPLVLGDFLMRVAGALQLPPPEGGFKPDSAAFALRGKGIGVRGEMTTRVTEADVVTILNGLGYRVRTTTPSRVVDEARAGLLITTFIPGKG